MTQEQIAALLWLVQTVIVFGFFIYGAKLKRDGK